MPPTEWPESAVTTTKPRRKIRKCENEPNHLVILYDQFHQTRVGDSQHRFADQVALPRAARIVKMKIAERLLVSLGDARCPGAQLIFGGEGLDAKGRTRLQALTDLLKAWREFMAAFEHARKQIKVFHQACAAQQPV